MTLKDRVAIVTGASSGIGRGIALALAREGAHVAVADIQEAPKKGIYHDTDLTTSTVEEIEKRGGKGIFVQTDVSDDESVRNLIERTVSEFGKLDILINNAGITIPGGIEETTIADYDTVMGVNLRALYVASKLAMPHLKKPSGRIIHIASVQSFGGGGGPAYAASKAGVVNLTRDTALELAPFGATVNAICPGYIETPIQDYLTSQEIEDCRVKTPLPRLGLPSDIGNAAVFFASDAAAWITGTALPVDGGWMASIF
ncbi:MAG: 3-oxoacyl-ACP reductase FabG [Gemmatimonadota bacterium]|nr:3-oxoacyl-ACP reductase FabG [Gemmatimonadota bacterium]